MPKTPWQLAAELSGSTRKGSVDI